MIDWLINIVNTLISNFNTYAQSNQVIAGAISLWGLGVLSYFGRNVPGKTWAIVAKQSTTSMILISSSQAYHNFAIWFYKQGYVNKARKLKVSSGRWGDDEAVKMIGYGNHFFFYRWVPMKVDMRKIDNTISTMERDEITLTILGRSHKFFDSLFEEIKKEARAPKNKIRVYKFNKDYWRKVTDQTKRNLETVFLDTRVKDKIISHIDQFLQNELWCLEHGIPYQTGILLYGYPGCGKTSLIKAIASEYNKSLYILSASDLHEIDTALMELPDNSILLIEDIDSDPVVYKREKEPRESKEKPKKTTSNQAKPEEHHHYFTLSNISDVLNALDGIITVHGRILFATTNHIEKLDSAVIRNGRFDLRVEISYATKFIVNSFFKKYYPGFDIIFNFEIKDQIPASDIQKEILNNLNAPEKVIEWIRK